MAKILLVEDNEMNRDMLSRRLTRQGYEVLLAHDGARGVEMTGAGATGSGAHGHEPAGARRVGGGPAPQGRSGDALDPCHRADRARHDGGPGEGVGRRLRRLRHQADRAAAASGKDAAAAAQGLMIARSGSERDRRMAAAPEPTRSSNGAPRLAVIWQDLVTPVRAILGYQEIIVEEGSGFGSTTCSRISTGPDRRPHAERPRRPDPRDERRRGDGRRTDRPASKRQLRHDLRTPLNAIIGYSEMVLEDLDSSPAQRRCGTDVERLLIEARQLLDGSTPSWTSAGATRRVPRPRKAIRMLPPRPPSSAFSGRCGPTASRRSPPKCGRILVVDDNESNRDLLCRRLVHEGHEVVVAASGLEALAILEERPLRPDPARPADARHERRRGPGTAEVWTSDGAPRR